MSTPEPTALVIETLLYCRELHSGKCTAVPVADLSRLAFGSEAAVRQDQIDFLEEYLLTAPAEVVANFALPPAIDLHEVLVTLERADLPRKLRTLLRVNIPCILVPDKRDHWVIVPVIDHTFHVARGADLDATVRAEVARIVPARELVGREFLDLLPAHHHELDAIEVSIEHEGKGIAGRAGSLRKARIAAHRRKTALELLASIATPLERARERPPLVGRAAELRALRSLLAGSDRGGILIIGDESVGKSALFQEWLGSPLPLGGKRPPVFATSGAQLIAGMSGLGEWQERVVAVMQAAELVDAVLYFENLAELFGGRSERGGTDIAGVMQRYLVEGRVRMVGELSPENIDHLEPLHAGLFAALSRVRLEPLTVDQSSAALAGHVDWWNDHEPERPRVSAALVEPVVELAERYLPYRAFPGKAIRFVDELRATREQYRDPSGERPVITLEHAYAAFSLATGIPDFLLREDQSLRHATIMARFAERIVGQEQAAARVADNICVVKARLQPADKPLSTFLFIGPTGVGKTELARALSEFLFGAADRMLRFDMSEYTDGFAAERLIRGTERDEGLLTGKVREQPFCVLLLDEIEKAHPAVFDLLLQVCGEGRLTDARGKTAYFHNAIIIMTSNLGAAHRRAPLGIASRASDDHDHYTRAVNKTFRPEFINRIDAIVTFGTLSMAEVRQVARFALARLPDRRGIQESAIELSFSDAALTTISERGYSATYGGRALRRFIDDHVVAPIARLLARFGPEVKGAFVWVSAAGEPAGHSDHAAKHRLAAVTADELRFELYRRQGAAGRRALRGISGLAEMRRNVDYWLSLDRAESVKEQASFLRSQLATARTPRRRKKKSQTSSAEIAALQVEHHRLQTAWDAASALCEEIHLAEELGLGALFDGQFVDDWSDETGVIYRRFRRELFYLLMAQQTPRDEVILALHDIDGAGVYAYWLAPLVAELGRRKWQAEFHIRSSKKEQAPDWPSDRAWGPPHDLAWLRGTVLAGDKGRDLLVRVRGPFAGCLLGLEAGLHRFRGVNPRIDPCHLIVRRMAMRTELSNREWLDPELAGRPARPSNRTAAIRTREVGSDTVRVLRKGGDVDTPAGYFRDIEEVVVEHLLALIESGDDDDLFPVEILRNPDIDP